MKFNEDQSIYLQIAEYVTEQILLGLWNGEEKIPSVRDLAAALQVNPNTVMHAYELLQQQGVLYNRRGIGHHVAPDAADKIISVRKETFLRSELPAVFRNLQLLGIGFEELERLYRDFTIQHPKN